MSFVTKLFKSKPGEDQPARSLLAEWNDYSAGEAPSSTASDIEAGVGKLFGSVKENTSGLVGSISRATSGIARTTSKTVTSVPSIPSRKQLYYFLALFGAGAFFLFLAVTVALPVVVVFPTKFAVSFTLGCFLIMASFIVLKGWQQQIEHMTSSQRLPFTAGYVFSMIMTLYASMVQHSYISSLFFSGVQVLALLYYVFSYLPGGAAGLQVVTAIVSRVFWMCLGTARKAVLK
mmetsp:Transcript_23792/g.51973  ORF Transcript_23792/g.51973 Transcript_23792/m.51973 type:complete len:233 (+) Transcript_23792:257-955(+)|eukprot:CAMPEP_0118927000 /NCGR_PEP_ID=MMETSP1169-20130426/4581_1 /TAXON_ID=36882 /ORGANISM="Pyramimonas obovata, Strain CCMP722" /LENGTH=232 /DNA_ID=CAMNT_0006868675 /DNA_START=253 /DNA_END=951 /DNA_ORIENTATION=-